MKNPLVVSRLFRPKNQFFVEKWWFWTKKFSKRSFEIASIFRKLIVFIQMPKNAHKTPLFGEKRSFSTKKESILIQNAHIKCINYHFRSKIASCLRSAADRQQSLKLISWAFWESWIFSKFSGNGSFFNDLFFRLD